MFFLVSAFYFFYFSIIGVHIIFMPKVLELLGYSGSEIGIIFSSAPLVRFLVPLLFIRGFKLGNTSFFAALAILTLSVITFYFSIEHFYALLLSNIFFGVGLSLVLPYIELISLHEIGKERYGKSRLFGSIGFMGVALVLVKFLHDPLVAINYLVTLSLITVIFATIVVKTAHSCKTNTHTNNAPVTLLQDWRLWVGFALMQMSFGAFYNFFTIYETAHGISMDVTIYLWSFGVLIEIVMLYFQGKLLQGNLLNILQFTTFATVIRWMLVFLFADNLVMMFLAQSIHALSFALFHSAAISYLFHLYTNKPLSQQLFSGISYGLGGLIGAVVAGYMYEYFPQYLFLLSAILSFGAFYCIRSYAKTTHPNNP
jgi:PPP family 3-phenylpropionic acid transporter